MIGAIILLLIVLWLFGFLPAGTLPIPNGVLFNINGQAITIWNIFVFLLIAWAIGILPSPFREIGGVLLLLWVLSLLGFLAIAGLSNFILIAVIIGLVIYLLGGSL